MVSRNRSTRILLRGRLMRLAERSLLTTPGVAAQVTVARVRAASRVELRTSEQTPIAASACTRCRVAAQLVGAGW